MLIKFSINCYEAALAFQPLLPHNYMVSDLYPKGRNQNNICYYGRMHQLSHEYSILIHDYISSQIKVIKTKQNAAANSGDRQFCNGQLKELLYIRKYLTDKIDLDTYKYYH
jgi:hypothetical protein